MSRTKKKSSKITGWTTPFLRSIALVQEQVIIFVTVQAPTRTAAVARLKTAGFTIKSPKSVRPTIILSGKEAKRVDDIPEYDVKGLFVP